MSTDSSNRKSSLVEIFKAVVAILGVPLALFAIVDSIIGQPITSLIVTLITAVIASVLVVRYGWTGVMEIIIAWLAMAVVVLFGFVILPKTMIVEGLVRDGADNLVSNEGVLLFDCSGRRYETQTDTEGHYQFIDVPTGNYRVRVGSTEVEGEAEGFLVRKVQQNITLSEILVAASPTPTPIETPSLTPTPTPTPTPEPPTDTPTPIQPSKPTDTPVPPTDTPVPPTDTLMPPTDTPVPPTDTPVPPMPMPPCPSADAEGTVPPAVAISYITFSVSGADQVVDDFGSLQASVGKQVEVKEVTICVDPFKGKGGQVYVEFDPVVQGGEIITSEVKGTRPVPATPGLTTIPGPNYTWTIGDNWHHISVASVHYPAPPQRTENSACERGEPNICEIDDRIIVIIE